MFRLRSAALVLGVLLLLLGGVLVWRATHPPLTEEQQVAVLVEDVRSAVATRNTNRLAGYFADDFTWNGQSKRELESTLRGTFFQVRDLQPSVSNLTISVLDAKATAYGNYSLRYRVQNTQTMGTRIGRFQLALEKRAGEWKIVRAQDEG